MLPILSWRSLVPSLAPRARWLAVPLVAFAIGATAAVVVAAPTPVAPAFGPALSLTLEREVAAAVGRMERTSCTRTPDAHPASFVAWGEERSALQVLRAGEQADPAGAVRRELGRLARALATPTCTPDLLELALRAASAEDALTVLDATVQHNALPAELRAEAITALDRLALPAIDVTAVLDRERDESLAGQAIRLHVPGARAEAQDAAHRALALHDDAGAVCRAGMTVARCALALARAGDAPAAGVLRRLVEAYGWSRELQRELGRRPRGV